jgi:hypothetical protein
MLAVSARATLTQPWYDGLVWFTVDVRKVADDGEETSVWSKDFGDHPSGWHEAKQGVEIRPELPEFKIPVAPGTYVVFVEVRENKPVATEDGAIIENFHGLAGRSVIVEVPGP